MKYAVVGTRAKKLGPLAHAYEKAVRFYVRNLPRDFTVVSGGADGVDSWAASEAQRVGLATRVFPVDREGLPPFGMPGSREEFARRAYARNQQIVDFSDAVIAFWDGKSPGTRDTLKRAAYGELTPDGRLVKAPIPWAVLTVINDDQMSVKVSEGLSMADLYILKESGH